jgi:hypothetical protein
LAACIPSDAACQEFIAQTNQESDIVAPTILWADNHTIHPSLDFVNEEAYVTVPLTIQTQDINGNIRKRKQSITITSGQRYFEATQATFQKLDLSIKEPPVILKRRWSHTSIQEYLEKQVTINVQDVFQRIREQYAAYIDFPQPETYGFMSLWVLGTYFFPLFMAYPYIYFGGLKQSGKTKTLTLTSLTAFNAIFSSHMTSSSLFRLIEHARCTLLIDETEGLDHPNRREDFRSILNAGYKQGSLVYRTHKDTHIPEGFEVYSPKIIANIRGLEDVLEDRCISFTLLRTNDRQIGNREINMLDNEWQTIRDQLYLLMLTTWQHVKHIYDTMQNTTTLSNRDWELWKPILTLAHWIDASLYNEMLHLALRKSQEKHIENVTETGEVVLVTTLLNLVTTPGYYKVKTIRDAMAAQYEEEQKWLSTKWVGRALKRLGFTDKRRLGTGIEYHFTLTVIANLADRLAIQSGEVSEVNEVSEEHTDVDKSNSETSITSSQSPLTSQTTLIESVEHYVREQRDVGIDKAANDLNLTPSVLLKVASATSNIVVGQDLMTLRWKQFFDKNWG